MKIYGNTAVGQIVAEDYNTAEIFDKYGIDYCCHGSISLKEACEKAGVNLQQIIKVLETFVPQASANTDFTNWPLDLLVDYILKIHHRNIRSRGPEILKLIDKVCDVHGENHPELYQIQKLFKYSLYELGNHLDKEELVLFPYIYDMVKAQEENKHLPDFHCGTIKAPISVMMSEHETEGERYSRIEKLAHGYTAPKDACNSYKLAYKRLKDFTAALHQHIHLENNIVFPRAIYLEQELKK